MADPGDVVARVAGFGWMLRAGGLAVGPGRVQDAVSALTVIDISSKRQVYWALRCTLLSRHDDVAVFDSVFASYFDGADGQEVKQACIAPSTPDRPGEIGLHEHAIPRVPKPSEAGVHRGEADEASQRYLTYSAVERLRMLDFEKYTEADLRRARQLMERIARAKPVKRSRRSRTAARGRAFDMRRTLRKAMHTDGYPIVSLWREQRLVPRRLVFAVDVSGSMQPYARAMLMFLHAAVRSRRSVEAFTFATRLTRVTAELQNANPQSALEASSRAVQDWASGTRIGSNLRVLNDQWGRLGVTRGAVVVIVSDGWERGDSHILGHEMARLRRSAHAVVWVNPLAGAAGYEPLVQGLIAALPHVDHLLAGHNLQSLEALADVLENLPR